jgi:tetratricopeptide (TPR) repeat protein
LVIVTFGSLAWKQASYWQDSESLWRHAITVTPDNHIAFTNLGDSLLKKNRTDDAIAQYQKALELVRTDSDAENGLGSALFREKQTDQAIDHYRKAIGFRPEDPEYHNNLGNALCERGLIDDGIANYEKALELRPDRADLSNAETEYNLANALLRKNQIDEAIVHFRRSLEIQPNDADTYDNLGNALQRRGMAAEAISQYQKALQIDPQHVRALGDFAWALATCSDATFRNGPKAVDLAERAKNLTGEADPVALRTLAAAYAEAGEFQRAIETARNAMQLANSQQNPRLTNILEREIALYQTNSPYHQTRR